jgi:hypothetical protein
LTPFDFVNSINQNKKDLLADGDVSESEYVPFVVNKALSYFPETILHANEMNRANIDNKLQYHYLLNSIRPGKRFAKWVKKDNVEDVEVVKQFYGYSTDKALQALTILSTDNLHYIKQKLQRGGENDKTRGAG